MYQFDPVTMLDEPAQETYLGSDLTTGANALITSPIYTTEPIRLTSVALEPIALPPSGGGGCHGCGGSSSGSGSSSAGLDPFGGGGGGYVATSYPVPDLAGAGGVDVGATFSIDWKLALGALALLLLWLYMEGR